jgi:hypothetical protein
MDVDDIMAGLFPEGDEEKNYNLMENVAKLTELLINEKVRGFAVFSSPDSFRSHFLLF